MYELICPSCRYTARLSFVRIGASVVCAGCGQRFVIAEQHVRRPKAASSTPPAPQPEAKSDPSSRPGLDDSGQMIGLSGLSEMMKREGAPPQRKSVATSRARKRPGSSPAPGGGSGGASRSTPVPAGVTPAPGTAAPGGVRRPTILMILLLLGVIGVIVLSGVLVWYNAHQRTNRPAPPTTTQSPD